MPLSCKTNKLIQLLSFKDQIRILECSISCKWNVFLFVFFWKTNQRKQNEDSNIRTKKVYQMAQNPNYHTPTIFSFAWAWRQDHFFMHIPKLSKRGTEVRWYKGSFLYCLILNDDFEMYFKAWMCAAKSITYLKVNIDTSNCCY